ncbi:hypothetical protein ACFL0A_01570 [Patescibacteria group bacterium]
MERIKTIKGRPVILTEEAPSWKNEFFKLVANEYKVGDIVPTLKFLISGTQVNEGFWRRANYSALEFKYKGKNVTLITNHGLELSMCKAIDGKIDISDVILDLSKLLATAIKDKNERELFKQEIQEKVKNGIKIEVVR